MGVAGLVALGVLATQRAYLASHRAPDAHAHTLRGSLALFLQPAILLCFAYFVVQTMASVGLQTFLPSALNAGFAVPLALATSAVTAYLLGGTAGILAGGFLAARTTRHDRVAAGGPAGRRALTAWSSSAPARVPRAARAAVRARSASRSASTGPSRDLIVRNATPKGAAGRVYGFVYSGLDLGATIGPVWFGADARPRLGARDVLRRRRRCFALAIGTVHPRAARDRRGLAAADAERRHAMDLGIAGRRALVCAASKGLGRGCAEALARRRRAT